MADHFRTSFDWDDLRYVLALARNKSLSATARALRVNHATVSRRIESVEDALGHLLFDRRADGYVLTADGAAVVEKAMAMETAALAVKDALGHQAGPSGIVRITSTRSFADMILADALTDLHRTAPGLTIELATDVRNLSIAQRGADIALRFGSPKISELVGRKVGEYSFGYYAAAGFIEARPDDDKAPLVGWDADSSFAPEFQWMDEHFPNHPYSLRSNSNYAQAAAAASGLGVALLPNYLGRGFPGLSPVAFGPVPPNREIWLLTRPDLVAVPRVRIVIDYLVTRLAQLRGRLVG